MLGPCKVLIQHRQSNGKDIFNKNIKITTKETYSVSVRCILIEIYNEFKISKPTIITKIEKYE